MNRNSSNYQNTLGVGSVSHDGWRVFKRIGAKLIHPSGGNLPPPRLEGFRGKKIIRLVILLCTLIVLITTPKTAYAVDSSPCTQFNISDDKGNQPDSFDPLTTKIYWRIVVPFKDSKIKFRVEIHSKSPQMGDIQYRVITSPEKDGSLGDIIERNAKNHDVFVSIPDPSHSLTVEIDQGGDNYIPYCSFDPAYTFKAPPLEQSATCSLSTSSNPDLDGKFYTPSSEIFVNGTVYVRGFTNREIKLNFPGKSMQVIRDNGDKTDIEGGIGVGKVNYPGGNDPNAHGDQSIDFKSYLGIQPFEGTYTVIVPRATIDTPETQSLPIDGITVYTPDTAYRIARDPYNRAMLATISCRVQFVIDEKGGHAIVAPTIAPECQLNTACDDNHILCASPCDKCPWCQSTNPKLPTISIPALKPLCDQINPNINAEQHQQCTDCVKGLGASAGKPGIWTAIGCIPTDMNQFLEQYVFKFGPGIAGGIAFLYFLYGAFLILTSTGDPEKVAQGKEILVSALSGLLLIIFSVFLLRVVAQDILSLPGFGQSSTPNSSSQIPPQCRRGTFPDREPECKPGDCNGNCKECPGC